MDEHEIQSTNENETEADKIIKLECDLCNAIFSDYELHDEHVWFNHREELCRLKYKGCQAVLSIYPHPQSLWYMSCDNC